MIEELDKTFYEIQVKGYLDARWNELFDGMSIAWQDNVLISIQSGNHG